MTVAFRLSTVGTGVTVSVGVGEAVCAGVKVSVGGRGVNEGGIKVAVGALVVVAAGMDVAVGAQAAIVRENMMQIESRVHLDFMPAAAK